jgi:hypothetical protein
VFLTLSSPISGADNSAIVDFDEISGGADQESADALIVQEFYFVFNFLFLFLIPML